MWIVIVKCKCIRFVHGLFSLFSDGALTSQWNAENSMYFRSSQFAFGSDGDRLASASEFHSTHFICTKKRHWICDKRRVNSFYFAILLPTIKLTLFIPKWMVTRLYGEHSSMDSTRLTHKKQDTNLFSERIRLTTRGEGEKGRERKNKINKKHRSSPVSTMQCI